MSWYYSKIVSFRSFAASPSWCYRITSCPCPCPIVFVLKHLKIEPQRSRRVYRHLPVDIDSMQPVSIRSEMWWREFNPHFRGRWTVAWCAFHWLVRIAGCLYVSTGFWMDENWFGWGHYTNDEKLFWNSVAEFRNALTFRNLVVVIKYRRP